jgi:hypothetical protein
MTALISTLTEVANQWSLTSVLEELDEAKAQREVHVGFLGDFSSGKSTLINEIVGQDDLLPTKAEPCNAVAGLISARSGLDAPSFFRQNEGVELKPLSHAEFNDLIVGTGGSGLPVCHVPSSQYLPPDFVLVDTPGLSSLTQQHQNATIGHLPYLDATVICIDVNKGGISESVKAFLCSAAARHLQQRLVVAVTQADRAVPQNRTDVLAKITKDLASLLKIPQADLASRVTLTSAGPKANPRNIDGLRAAIFDVFEARRRLLLDERVARCAARIVPRAIHLLEQLRDAASGSEDATARRRAEVQTSLDELVARRREQEDRLSRFQTELRGELKLVVNRYRPALVAANDTTMAAETGRQLCTALGQTVDRHFAKFNLDMQADFTGHDAEMLRSLNEINRYADFGKTLATAVLTAVIIPGGAVAGNAAQAAGGAATRAAAAAGAKAIAKQTIKAAAAAFFAKASKVIDQVNPVNFIGDIIAEKVRDGQIDAHLEQVAGDVAGQAMRAVEAHFEDAVFQPIERDRKEAQRLLAELTARRRENASAAQETAAKAASDIERLRFLEQLADSAPRA